MRIIGDHEYAVAGHGHAAIHSSRRGSANAPRATALIVPDRPAAAGVKRPAFVSTRDIHDACHHYRRQLKVGAAGQLENPSGRQARHVAGIDLRKFAVAIPAGVAVVAAPIDIRGDRAIALPFLA